MLFYLAMPYMLYMLPERHPLACNWTLCLHYIYNEEENFSI